MSKLKVHFSTTGHKRNPFCDKNAVYWSNIYEVTNDWSRVTCKRCLARSK